MIVEEGEVRVLTDPGVYTTTQTSVTNLSAIVITHEHADHFHIESLKTVLHNNPQAQVVTNSAVGTLLAMENIPYIKVEDNESFRIGELLIEGKGKGHALIYPSIPSVMNTGFFIGKKLYYPGDALSVIDENVDVLALPVAGPWIKMSEAIDFAKKIHPRICFPVHDGWFEGTDHPFHRVPQKILTENGIDFTILSLGEAVEL